MTKSINKAFITLCFIFCITCFSFSVQSAEKQYRCEGWYSFQLVNQDGNESQVYILREPNKTSGIYTRYKLSDAEGAMKFDLENEAEIFRQEKRAKKVKSVVLPNQKTDHKVFCWLNGIFNGPDTSNWPKDNTGRSKPNQPVPAPIAKNPNAPFLCTQRIVYYLLGEDPKDRSTFIYRGEDPSVDRKKYPDGRKRYSGPVTSAESEVMKDALRILKSQNNANIVLIDHPTAECLQ